MPFHPLSGRSIHAGHGKREFHAVIFNAAIFRHFPVSIGKAGEEAGHHGVNGFAALIFAEVGGVVGSVCGEQWFDEREIVSVGQGHVVSCQCYRFVFTH